jgi:hypothetical protein
VSEVSSIVAAILSFNFTVEQSCETLQSIRNRKVSLQENLKREKVRFSRSSTDRTEWPEPINK